jgi:leader peptidase (prepilin peptidase) / N-methyltransferase
MDDMTIILIIIFGVLGLAIGSFLNVCIDRLPAKKSLVFPSSHCDACQHALTIKDLIPVVSYLWIHGKCRYCGAHIPVRVPLVELGTGILLAVMFWHYGLTWQFPLYAVYACVLLVLAVIDLEHTLLLNIIVYPTAIIAFIIGFFLPEFSIYKGVLGGACGFVILLIVALIFRGGMGWGDVKMAGMMGLMTGFPNIFVALMLGIILGGLIAVALILLKKKGRKDMIPFGPFLALGALVTLLYGKQILDWYLNLF